MHRLLATTAALAVAGLGLAGSPATPAHLHWPTPGHPGGTASTQVSAWVTTADGSQKMAPQAPLAFTTGSSDRTTITIDPRTTYQTMSGFGGALTDSSAAVLYELKPAERAEAMTQLFSPTDGIGVDFLREPIGSSDFTASATHYTYDDVAPGKTDFGLEHFSIAHDEKQVLPLLRAAKKLQPKLQVMATPWSPPAWMKTNDSLIGGRLKDQKKVYRAYAAYLTRFVQAYTTAGVPVDYLSVQNEPQNRDPKTYPGTDMPAWQEAKVIEQLGPMLAKASPRTKILGYDHNWTEHPNDVASVPPGEDPETDYPYELLDSPAAKWISGTAYHCYYGDPSAQTALHDAHPDKGIYFTECSGSHGAGDTPAQYFSDTLKWHARTITIGTTRSWAKSVADWNVALNDDGTPHNGGCDTCTGMLAVHADGTFSTNAEYYTIGHLSKFVQPGAVRIASTSYGTTGWNGQLTDVAFRNPDGSTALVVHNENDDPRDMAVAVGSQEFEFTMPGASLATFTWPASATRGLAPWPVSLAGATATASSSTADAGNAIDADGTTLWQSGAAAAPGQYLQVELKHVGIFRTVAFDSGGNLGDYPPSWKVTTSLDGTHWRTAATGTSTGQVTTADLRLTIAKYVRITATGAAPGGNWWTLADVRLYH